MVIESPDQPQPNQNTDSDTESTSDKLPSDILFLSETQSSQFQAATKIQRQYRTYYIRSKFLNYLQAHTNLNRLPAVQIQRCF
jgi:hypothetical protein